MNRIPNISTPRGTLCKLVRDKPIRLGDAFMSDVHGWLWKFLHPSTDEDPYEFGYFQSFCSGVVFEDLFYDRFEVLEAQEDKETNHG